MIKETLNKQPHARDLLPNEQEISYENIFVFLNRYKFWMIGLVLLIGIIFAQYLSRDRKERDLNEKAAAAFSEAHSVDSIESVVQNFPNTNSALLALMSLGDLHFKQSEWDKALSSYQKAIDQYPSSLLAPSAVIGVAASLEANGKTEEALKKYQSVVSHYPHSFQAPQAQHAVGRLLESMGRIPEARKTYEDLLAQYPNSAWKNDSSTRLGKLNAILKKAPEKNAQRSEIKK